MSRIRDAALAYAAHGWHVLRCYTNTEEGCSCKRSGCPSPGKHPLRGGVHEATTDSRRIRKWGGRFNLAIALGHAQLLVFDLDDSRAARELMRQEGSLLDRTGVVRTRGTHQGLHVYFMCVGEPPATRDIFLKGGEETLGQIRGVGSYVVAPPSIGVGGKRRYRWIGDLLDEWTPQIETVEDPLLYVQQLLRPIGIEVEAHQPEDIGPLEGAAIKEVTKLPKALRSDSRLQEVRLVLEGKLSPTVGDLGNRSDNIHRTAVLIAHTAVDLGAGLKEKRLAGIIRTLDRNYFGKYTDRSESLADREYLRSARKALRRAEAEQPEKWKASAPAAGGDDLVGAEEAEYLSEEEGDEVAGRSYLWDEEIQRLCYVREKPRGGRTLIPIANFLPEISATAVIDDPDEAEKETAWRLRVRRSERGDAEGISLRADEYDRSRTLSAALSRKLPYGFSILQGGEEHMQAAIKAVSQEDAPTYRVPAVPGWYERDGRRAYVLPGADVAIGGGGVEVSFHLHKDDLRETDPMRYPPLSRYGLGVRPPLSKQERRESWREFQRLFEACARPHIAAAVILQVLGGPLFDAGLSEVPPLVHLVGRTGTLKTSYCLAALSLMGRFSDISAPVTWRSTPLGMSQALNRARHMTLLFDDHKRSHSRRRDVVGMIQQYADGSHMVRHSLSGQPFERPRGLILSNGEDRIAGEASVAARTTSVEIREGDVFSGTLAQCQEAAENGALARFGAIYLQWLAGSGVLEDGSFREARDRWHERLLGSKEVVAGHRRTLRSAASLLAIGSIVRRFVKEEGPDSAYQKLREGIRSLREHFVETSGERAQEIEEQAPLDHLASFLSDKMAAGEAKFCAKGTGPDYPQRMTARVVGWHHKGTAYLSEHLTFAFYQEEMRRRGEEASHDWSSITQDIRERYGPEAHTHIWVAEVTDPATGETSDKASKRVYAIPMAILDSSRPERKKRSKSRRARKRPREGARARG